MSATMDRRSPPDPIRSHGHAVETLDDAPFIAYALIQAFKLFASLVAKRWPQLR